MFAGANRSAELKNPPESIPKGTFSAWLTTTTVYIILCLLLGLGIERSILRDSNIIAFAEVAWPLKVIVQVAIIVSATGKKGIIFCWHYLNTLYFPLSRPFAPQPLRPTSPPPAFPFPPFPLPPFPLPCFPLNVFLFICVGYRDQVCVCEGVGGGGGWGVGGGVPYFILRVFWVWV